MLPKLTQLLEENRPRVDEYQRKQRLERRRCRANELLGEFSKEKDPYQSIVRALQRPALETGVTDFPMRAPDLRAPFPSHRVIGKWDFLVNLFTEENPLERVDELFNERRDMISQQLLEWRTKVEDQLVNQYISSFVEATRSSLNTVLSVKGRTDATKDLSHKTRFLLRADTVFVESEEGLCFTEIDNEHGPISRSIHFPKMSPIQNYPFLQGRSFELDPDRDAKELGLYVRHAGKEAIVKALLKELGMPDAAHVEMVHMVRVFICGRCNHSEARTWHEMVEHYHIRTRDWVNGKSVRSIFTAKYPVVHRNIHDIQPGTISQPLVRIGADTHTSFNPIVQCLICRWNERFESYSFDSLDKARQHMLEVHDTPEPVEGVHYMPQSQLGDVRSILRAGLDDRVEWEKKWDEYHDFGSVKKHKVKPAI
ncbi:hypothetical protein OPQ81_002739 [Rhizoctonia solani]|nr:hypothetical protein OPQ81_002739 [Rhizoctonia solani]